MIGYFGKVSTCGDFVSRGLPADLVAAWDQWLQQCICESRQQLGDQWLEHYLTSPVWRFAMSPGILSPEGLGGVMMPSVDRVGRYFPLMIGATGAPPLLHWFRKQADWYDGIEALARASLDPAFRLDQLDAAKSPDAVSSAPVSSAGKTWRFPFDEDADERVVAAAMQGYSLWWTDGSPNVDASVLLCAGMPGPRAFTATLDGSWIATGGFTSADPS